MPEKFSEKVEVQDSVKETRVLIDATKGDKTDCSLEIRRDGFTVNDKDYNSRASLNFFPDGSIFYLTGSSKDQRIIIQAFKDSGKVNIRDSAGIDSIVLDGAAGDIILNNADCAEHFELLNPDVEAGTVMIIEDEGKLEESNGPYDSRVAGVLSCGGNCKPAIILDKKNSNNNQKPLALIGKVFCKAEAITEPIEVGDLLTTSSIPGHAMKASDPVRSFGAIIGKALRSLKGGRGLIPILVTLQ